jgi:hypothetical protein
MSGAGRVAATVAGLALLLPLAGCGKYGKPVRKSRAFAASSGPQWHGAVQAGQGAVQAGQGEAGERAQEKKRVGR